jgi:hypothetical protein
MHLTIVTRASRGRGRPAPLATLTLASATPAEPPTA